MTMVYAEEPVKCKRCGRRLKNPIYKELGYGPTCAKKEGITVPKKTRGNPFGEGPKVISRGRFYTCPGCLRQAPLTARKFVFCDECQEKRSKDT